MNNPSNNKQDPMKFFIVTLGCKVNQHESQQMAEHLSAEGMLAANSMSETDVIIINSCTVTSTADQKTRQTLHRARRSNPNAVICMSGCAPQALPHKVDAFSDADIIIGNSNREELPALIRKFLSERHPIVNILPHSSSSGLMGGLADFGERSRSYIKIEDGCNRFCAYCIIPYARGRVRSRALADIKAEAEALGEHYREVVLVGINLSAYGSDIGLSLADAVKTVASVDGIKRIRFGSVEPDLIDDALLEQLADEPKFCPQFHMSIQSGCDSTLSRMNRHYTSSDYMNIVESIRRRFDNPSITTDIMVGFPGETEEEFAQSLRFFESVGFARAHCFAYSRREGTVADTMPDQVPPQVMNERSAAMIKSAENSARSFMLSQVGSVSEVLAERETADGLWEGYTKNYTPVKLTGVCERGNIYRVHIDSAEEDFCTGHIIGKV